MARYIEKLDKLTLPAIITRGLVVFPEISMSFEVNRDMSLKSLEAAQKNDSLIFFASQNILEVEEPDESQINKVGTIGKIRQVLKISEGNTRIMIEGLSRAEAVSFNFKNGFYTCEVFKKSITGIDENNIRNKALISEALKIFGKYEKYIPKLNNDLEIIIHSIKNPGVLADYIAINFLENYERKQEILEMFDPCERLEQLCVILEKEIELLEIEEGIHRKVKNQLNRNQREFFLREQLKVIQNELNIGTFDFESETEIYRDMLIRSSIPQEHCDKVEKEIIKLGKMQSGSPEAAVMRNYLDLCFEIPWGKKTKDRLDIEKAEQILNGDHYGLEKVKERILEFMAVKQMHPELKNQIICLVGPPGVGKTSVAESIAKVLKRKFVRISLGGIRDEAEIRGHRRTYIGAMPGRIINAVKLGGSMNPLILLDEIDKLTRDSHGDPASALLEVLDAEQNKAFRDNFLELPVDLSDCLFITTANTLDTIPRPLMDRMEVIMLTSYTRNEKYHIAENHLYAKQLKKHGLNRKILKITDDALYEVIDYYTREAGVRNLERELASLIRKSVKKMLTEKMKSMTINSDAVRKLLGVRKFKDDSYSKENEVGVVNGLAWTAMGGEILQVEVIIVDGTGKIELTGSLGDVMKESARAALSFLRTIAEKYNIEPDFYTKKDIHIHFPEGAIPKDGPSAGITIATAIFSQLTGYPVRNNVAMTGEITLRGKVLPIGGLKEKTVAAYKAKIETVILPDDNQPDLEEIDKSVYESIKFIPAKNIEEVFREAVIFPTLTVEPAEITPDISECKCGVNPVYVQSGGNLYN